MAVSPCHPRSADRRGGGRQPAGHRRGLDLRPAVGVRRRRRRRAGRGGGPGRQRRARRGTRHRPSGIHHAADPQPARGGGPTRRRRLGGSELDARPGQQGAAGSPTRLDGGRGVAGLRSRLAPAGRENGPRRRRTPVRGRGDHQLQRAAPHLPVGLVLPRRHRRGGAGLLPWQDRADRPHQRADARRVHHAVHPGRQPDTGRRDPRQRPRERGQESPAMPRASRL